MTDDEREKRDQRFREAMYARYNVRSDAELPYAFMKLIPKKPLEAQLASRKVRVVTISTAAQRDALEARLPPNERIEWVACITPHSDIDGFWVRLLAGGTITAMAFDLGHEVGHTFSSDLSDPDLERWASDYARPPIRVEEAACDSFGKLWVNRFDEPNSSALIRRLERMKAHPDEPWIIGS